MSSPAIQVRTRIPRLAEAAVGRARLTVVPRRRTRAGRAPFLALVTMILLGGVVGLLLFNTSMQQASFTSTALEQQAERLAARQQSLEMELEQLRDPQRIASAAARLGMVQACNPVFLRLGSGSVVGQPCAAGGTPPLQLEPKAPTRPAFLDPQTKVVKVMAPPVVNPAGDTAGSNPDSAARGGKKKNNR